MPHIKKPKKMNSILKRLEQLLEAVGETGKIELTKFLDEYYLIRVTYIKHGKRQTLERCITVYEVKKATKNQYPIFDSTLRDMIHEINYRQ